MIPNVARKKDQLKKTRKTTYKSHIYFYSRDIAKYGLLDNN